MKFSIRFADQIVGALVILALAILVFVIFMLGKNQRWFVNDSQYVTYFTSASGISPNMAVQYKGFTIGHVKELSLDKREEAREAPVKVIFTIFEDYADMVKEGTVVEKQESPIGLGSSFVIYFGNKEGDIPEKDGFPVIPEINSPDAKKYIAEGNTNITRPSDSINNIVSQVNELLGTINKALAGSDEKSAIGQIVNNVERTTTEITTVVETLSDELKPLIANLEQLTEKINNPNGAIAGILKGTGPLYEGIDSLAGIIKNLKETSEFIPAQLPQIAVAVSELNKVLVQVQDVLTKIANNPLLKNGAPEHIETGPAGASPRNQSFGR
ncbi:MAG: MlaD family protein [Treponema sp.]|jgi:phospholipid/cholesterol/gamma-HCH transport system substrate-binding protein|nr:MlaD family protein [Treponema sp.]